MSKQFELTRALPILNLARQHTDIYSTGNNPLSINDIKKKKVYGETAIPTGTYKLVIDYSNRFKKNMAHILNVPGYEGIRIHTGNSAKDSLGCIIVGKNKVVGKVVESRNTYN